jgi:hypothetical protein
MRSLVLIPWNEVGFQRALDSLPSLRKVYTRDAYAPLRRDAQTEVRKSTRDFLPKPFHFRFLEIRLGQERLEIRFYLRWM